MQSFRERAVSRMHATTAAILFVFLFSFLGLPSAHAEHQAGRDHEILGTRYLFSRQLHPRYTLYWNFNTSARTIQFAVRVQTSGWVGFGLSPNGQMPGSDVVIGWVNQQGVVFHDRNAERRSTPPIDAVQNWFLVRGEESNGFTTLAFTRDLISCDDTDMNIEAETSHVVWSFKEVDPPIGATRGEPFAAHDYKGTASLNLLGGILDRPQDPPDTKNFTVATDNIIIPPANTTYWCAAVELPQEVQQQRQYVIRFTPHITPGNEPYVHHMLVYLCDQLPAGTNITGKGGNCDDPSTLSQRCFNFINSPIVGAWAVGGEEFVYPSNIAFPVGGGNVKYVLIQMHYDNPSMRTGIRDSSGMTFFYISTPREHDAGVMTVGHVLQPNMIIPPNANDFIVHGLCSSSCTKAGLPEKGIHIFANVLHTHTVGHGLELQHLRRTEQCGGIEELPPVERNLRYDFNFQQINHLQREVIVKPGDTLLLRCLYTTARRRTRITLAGESTQEEMCFSFFFYYPQVNLTTCLSGPITQEVLTSFTNNTVPPALQPLFIGLQRNFSRYNLENAFNRLPWNQEEVTGLQQALSNSTVISYCGFDQRPIPMTQQQHLPTIQCRQTRNETPTCPPSAASSLFPSTSLASLTLVLTIVAVMNIN